MYRCSLSFTRAAVAVGLSLSGGAVVVGAADGKISHGAKTKSTITSLSRSLSSARAVGRAMMVDPKLLLDAEFRISPPRGTPRAIGSAPHEKLAGFPRFGSTFGILSSGCATLANTPNNSDGTSCNDGGPAFRGTRDTTIMRLKVRVPKNASCLSFRFRFLSEEFPEFVGSPYNDAFIAELDRTTWTSDFNNPAISAPDDFARTVDGHLISVNATGVAAVSAANASGTTYDAATRVLRASTPVKPGIHRVYFTIFDQGDRQYDSSVLLDQLTIDHRSPCTRGVAS